MDELGPRLATLDAICGDVGRDPATIGRGAGISVNPLQPSGWRASVISGPPEEIADALRSFREAGFTQVDIMLVRARSRPSRRWRQSWSSLGPTKSGMCSIGVMCSSSTRR